MVVKVSPSITLQLEKSGQKITLGFDEAKEIIKSLSHLANQMRSSNVTNTTMEGNAKHNSTTTKKKKVKAAYKNEKKTGKRRRRIGRKSSTRHKSPPKKRRK